VAFPEDLCVVVHEIAWQFDDILLQGAEFLHTPTVIEQSEGRSFMLHSVHGSGRYMYHHP
jgi:hypothetical protein